MIRARTWVVTSLAVVLASCASGDEPDQGSSAMTFTGDGDETSSSSDATQGESSAGDGDSTTGDGDGTATGDGDGTATGDGTSTGDGDGTSTGDGDGTSTGDGDGTSGDGTSGDGDGDGTSGDGTSGDGTSGDGTSGDGDGTSGDGDGDGTSGDGDGDGTSGDGDGTSGDGDGTSGDGDGTSGDGDGTSGDGDGTSGDGDGTSGDGDGTSGDGDGDGCTPSCTVASETRCSGTTLETCTDDGAGCLEWMASEECTLTTNGACGGSPAACFDACAGAGSACATAGDAQCIAPTSSSTSIETCTDISGCLVWVAQDCSLLESFGDCTLPAPNAVCSACVNEPCTIGETSCSGDIVLDCIDNGFGCGDWEAPGAGEDCTISTPNGACDEAVPGAAACIDLCAGASCSTAGQTQCNPGDPNLLQTCTAGGMGCLGWVDSACNGGGTPQGACTGSFPGAACDPCVNEVCTPNDTQCVVDTLQTCTADGNGCGVWQATADCAGVPGGQGTCDSSGSPAVCVDPCSAVPDTCSTAGTKLCDTVDSAIVLQCGVGPSSCLVWQSLADCVLVEGDNFATCDLTQPDDCAVPDPCATEQPTPVFDPPQIALVLDRSGSMFGASNFYDHDNNAGTADVSRWDGLHVAVDNVLTLFEDKINFGSKEFPNVPHCGVNPGIDVACAPGNRGAILAQIPPLGSSLSGGTPAESAVDETLGYLQGLTTGGPRAMIYMSDGETTCSESSANVETAIANARVGGIPTFVVGINANAPALTTELQAFGRAANGTATWNGGTVVTSDGFETGNLAGLFWTTGGSAPWTVTAAQAETGVFSARSGTILGNQVSDLSLSFSMGIAGAVLFDHRESTEAGFDHLEVWVDGSLQGAWSGINDWRTNSAIPLTAGPHTLLFRYAKDNALDGGVDTVWIDDFQIVEGGTAPAQAWFDGTDTASLEAAMDAIIDSTIVCEVSLGLAPPYPDAVDVQVGGVQYVRLDPAGGAFDCVADDGWYYTDELTTCDATYPGPPSPAGACTEITLCGAACTSFKAMSQPTAAIQYYCSAG